MPADDLLWMPAAASDRSRSTRAAEMDDAASALGGEQALARVERTYLLARAVVAVGLVLVHAALAATGVTASQGVWLVLSIYTVQTLALRVWGVLESRRGKPAASLSPWQPSMWRIVATLGVDFATFAVLHVQQSGVNFNFAALLVLPVLMAGVLLPRRVALAVAAGVTLSLLGMAWNESLQTGGGGSAPMQSGLAGIGLFVVAWIGGELAGRLVREERVARGSLALARQQSALNRLVIDQMGEGVVVIDRRLQIRAMNPAARSLLGWPSTPAGAATTLRDRPGWAPLAQLADRAFEDHRVPAEGQEIQLDEGSRRPVHVRVRVRFTPSPPPVLDPTDAQAGEEAPAYGVLLLEDGRAAQARLQQEKLAAMGRVSAGIAHEIRNPLAAIAQANALLIEEPLPAGQQRLAGIVNDNVRRLQRIVDDVLAAVPAREEPEVPIDAVFLLQTVLEEWCRTQALSVDELRLQWPAAPLGVMFDPEHLRRVVINLLDNARTHSSGASGSIAVRLEPAEHDRARLVISNDGASVPPEASAHLFEPFFSTRSRGSGLGLYICRELCDRYGARIEHQSPVGGAGAAFVVTLRRPAPAVPFAHGGGPDLRTSRTA